jgi:hypothetical protein
VYLYVQSGTLELDQLVKIFIVYYQITWLIIVSLRQNIDQSKLSPYSHKGYLFNVHSNIILKHIHTSNCPYALRNISGKYFFCTITRVSIYIMKKHELEVIFFPILQKYSSVHSNFSTEIINQAQFLITRGALKCRRCSVLLSKTFAVNALKCWQLKPERTKLSKIHLQL